MKNEKFCSRGSSGEGGGAGSWASTSRAVRIRAGRRPRKYFAFISSFLRKSLRVSRGPNPKVPKKICGLSEWFVNFGGTVALESNLPFGMCHIEMSDGLGNRQEAMHVMGVRKHLQGHVPGGHAVLSDQSDDL